jgi:hypothetical protein
MIEKFLKKILNTAKLRNEYQSRDWDNFPLPLLPREYKTGAEEDEKNAILASLGRTNIA